MRLSVTLVVCQLALLLLLRTSAYGAWQGHINYLAAGRQPTTLMMFQPCRRCWRAHGKRRSRLKRLPELLQPTS